jgi:hypothetical protein
MEGKGSGGQVSGYTNGVCVERTTQLWTTTGSFFIEYRMNEWMDE